MAGGTAGDLTGIPREDPPIPPHADFEQVKDAAEAVIKGDPDAAGIVRKGIKTKAQELFTRKG